VNPLDLLFGFSFLKFELIPDLDKGGALAYAILLAWSLEYAYVIRAFFISFPEKGESMLSRP